MDTLILLNITPKDKKIFEFYNNNKLQATRKIKKLLNKQPQYVEQHELNHLNGFDKIFPSNNDPMLEIY